MRNSYEASEVFTLGRSQDVVLGSKPETLNQVDNIFGINRRTEPLPDDIDESDE